MRILLTRINNFFNAFEQEDVIVKTSNELVQEIHDEFDSSFDKREEHIQKMLSELSIETESSIVSKGLRLEKLGFTSSEVVKKAKKQMESTQSIEANKSTLEEKMNFFKELKKEYPFDKFITFKDLQGICKKYNLIYAPVNRYLKDVPEKNINEIEKRKPLRYSHAAGNREFIKVTAIWSHQQIDSKLKPFIKDFVEVPEESIVHLYDLRAGSHVAWKNIFGINSSGIKNLTTKTIEQKGLFICAPKTHFNLEDLDVNGEFGYAFKTILEVKDPVVFEFVAKGMCRIISKWGLEASDEVLVNPIEN